jgi:pimeloyl-[acyl-carrier protein] methyl ester esterase
MKKHLVMLHGFGCDSRVFASIGTKLSKDFDVLMVDLPGHGQTKEKFRDFSFAGYTILHALDQYLGEPYSLLGWSMGGQIALEMYKHSIMRHEAEDEKCDCGHDHHHEHEQAHIASLILVSSTPKFVASDDFKIGMNAAVFNKFRKGIESGHEKALADFYGMMFAPSEHGDKYLDELKKMTPSSETLKECMKSFARFDERKLLPSISVPTLILAGDSDGIIDPKASLYMSQEIKNSSLKMFSGAGHAPHLTREEEMIDEISKFLG